jgi:hypothetical protein
MSTVEEAVSQIVESQDESLAEPIKAALEDIGGGKLTTDYIEQLEQLDEDKLRAVYEESDVLKGLFASGDDLVSYFNTVVQNAAAAFDDIKYSKDFMTDD